jgi:hypothetical protein
MVVWEMAILTCTGVAQLTAALPLAPSARKDCLDPWLGSYYLLDL